MNRLSIEVIKGVSYWNTKEGAGIKVDGTKDDTLWSVDASFADKTFHVTEGEDIQKSLVDHIKSSLGIHDDVNPSWFNIMDEGRLSLTIIEDGEGNYVNDDDDFIASNPNLQLYICDYDIMVEVQEVTTPSRDKLAKLFPNAERGF